MAEPWVVVPNWNGESGLRRCLDSLRGQSAKAHVVVVDNGSVDGSVALVEGEFPEVELVRLPENTGFAGGVNVGFRLAIEAGAEYVAAFNNDATAERDWLRELVAHLDRHPEVGIAACKLLTADGERLDSTGDFYTDWGLPFPRGRDETDLDAYDESTEIFAGSGGASLYRVSMLEQVGPFDEKFFAYYEDVDLGFRAQMAGWKVAYVPPARAHHDIGATSGRLHGFATCQTFRNLPMLLLKNVPRRHLWRVGWRCLLVQTMFFGRAAQRGEGWPALKGTASFIRLLPRVLGDRRRIQARRVLSDEQVWDLLVHDLPPASRALRRLRGFARRLQGRA